MSKKSLDALTRIALQHAKAEGEGDLAGTLATLEADPVYELYPVGLKLRGMSGARRYYEYFFAAVAPRIAGYQLISESVGPVGVVQEYDLDISIGTAPLRRYRILGILTFGTEALSGERLYADTALLEFMFETVWSELVPV